MYSTIYAYVLRPLVPDWPKLIHTPRYMYGRDRSRNPTFSFKIPALSICQRSWKVTKKLEPYLFMELIAQSPSRAIPFGHHLPRPDHSRATPGSSGNGRPRPRRNAPPHSRPQIRTQYSCSRRHAYSRASEQPPLWTLYKQNKYYAYVILWAWRESYAGHWRRHLAFGAPEVKVKRNDLVISRFASL